MGHVATAQMAAFGASAPSAQPASNDRLPNLDRTLVAALVAFRFCPFAVVLRRQLDEEAAEFLIENSLTCGGDDAGQRHPLCSARMAFAVAVSL